MSAKIRNQILAFHNRIENAWIIVQRVLLSLHMMKSLTQRRIRQFILRRRQIARKSFIRISRHSFGDCLHFQWERVWPRFEQQWPWMRLRFCFYESCKLELTSKSGPGYDRRFIFSTSSLSFLQRKNIEFYHSFNIIWINKLQKWMYKLNLNTLLIFLNKLNHEIAWYFLKKRMVFKQIQKR